jgi:hypothetical protein
MQLWPIDMRSLELVVVLVVPHFAAGGTLVNSIKSDQTSEVGTASNQLWLAGCSQFDKALDDVFCVLEK